MRIYLVEAQKLAAKDNYVKGLMAGMSDPYAILRVGPQSFTSKHIDNTDSPKWQEMYEVRVVGGVREGPPSTRVNCFVSFMVSTSHHTPHVRCQSSCLCVCVWYIRSLSMKCLVKSWRWRSMTKTPTRMISWAGTCQQFIFLLCHQRSSVSFH